MPRLCVGYDSDAVGPRVQPESSQEARAPAGRATKKACQPQHLALGAAAPDTDAKIKNEEPFRTKMNVQFSKTKMCKFAQLGCCQKGANCQFAHDLKELQAPPDLSLTKMCPTLAEGVQCKNPECQFAHSSDELRTTSMFHKTKLCRFWQAGRCANGLKCGFAHSSDELRSTLEGDGNSAIRDHVNIQ